MKQRLKKILYKNKIPQNFLQQKLTFEQLCKDQKYICCLLHRIYKLIRMDVSAYQLLQKQLTSIIHHQIYQPIKQALNKQENIGAKHQLFKYLLSRNPFNQFFGLKQSLNEKIQAYQLSQEKKCWNINNIVFDFTVQNKLPSPPSFDQKIQVAYKHFCITLIPGLHIIDVDNQQSNHLQDQCLVSQICRLLNHAQKGGSLIIGINKSLQIKGIKFNTQTQWINWKHKIQAIREYQIFPPPQENQKFYVNFIKVKSLSYETQYFGKSIDIKAQNFYLIEIYANTQNVNKVFFVKEKSQKAKIIECKNQKFKLFLKYNGSLQQTSLKQGYEQIHQNYSHKDNYKTKKPIKITKMIQTSQIQYKAYKEQPQKNKVSDIYGKIPNKFFAHHSIVIVAQKGIDLFKKFLLTFNQKQKNEFKYYTIYENLQKSNNRQLYYFTHKKNIEDVRRLVQNLDHNRKLLVYMKIKPQITLLRQQFFPNAYKALKARFQNYFSTKLEVLYKRNPQNPNQLEYYFRFENQIQSIFAFALLQSSDIRSNFANIGKLQNCKDYEEIKKQFPSLYIQI